jgi:hypothetical protein
MNANSFYQCCESSLVSMRIQIQGFDDQISSNFAAKKNFFQVKKSISPNIKFIPFSFLWFCPLDPEPDSQS